MSSSDSAPVPQRRRSSILRRISVGTALNINTTEFAHKQYIAEAKQETQEWINLAKQRRQQAKIAEAALSQVSDQPPVLTFEDVKGDLRPEDLEFLAARPNYEKIVSDTDNFIEKVALLKTSFEEVDSLSNVCESLVKSRVNSIASDICLYNDVEPYLKVSNLS